MLPARRPLSTTPDTLAGLLHNLEGLPLAHSQYLREVGMGIAVTPHPQCLSALTIQASIRVSGVATSRPSAFGTGAWK